jgi:hypothetical protein
MSAATVIAPYWEPKAAPMQMLFYRNNIEAGHTPSPGLFTTIRSSFYLHAQNLAPFFFTASSVIIHINNKKNSCVWAPYLDIFRRHFPTGAHHAQTRKMKNSIRKRTFKSKRTCSWCVEMSDLSNDTKKHTTKYRETIPLSHVLLLLIMLLLLLQNTIYFTKLSPKDKQHWPRWNVYDPADILNLRFGSATFFLKGISSKTHR